MRLYQFSQPALKQLAEWAQSYVQNETGIPETPDAQLTDAQKGALLLMELLTDGTSK